MLKFQNYRHHVDEIYLAALEAVEPASAVKRFLHRTDHRLEIAGIEFNLDHGRVFIVSVGKAAIPMTEAAVDVLGDAVYAAGAISKRGGKSPQESPIAAHPAVQLMEGSHPVSGQDSVRSTAVLIDRLHETTADDLVLCLISGGASALFTQPIISLPDWQLLINALLASGCTINELNTVRRQLDTVKGGGLAHLAAPANCVTLILSDVVGNPLEAIGSGPTILFSETPEDALAILDRYSIMEEIGRASFERIAGALQQQGAAAATPPVSTAVFIVGDVKQAALAAKEKAASLGFQSEILTVHLEGEAREVGRVAAAIAKDTSPGKCLIFGGETTVTLRGPGRGGRNQETALAAALALEGWPHCVIASVATDGEDGPTPAAGAVVAGWTTPFAMNQGLSPQEYLDRNDSFTFFTKLDARNFTAAARKEAAHPPCLVLTGSTGTNVNDLLLILTYEKEDG